MLSVLDFTLQIWIVGIFPKLKKSMRQTQKNPYILTWWKVFKKNTYVLYLSHALFEFGKNPHNPNSNEWNLKHSMLTYSLYFLSTLASFKIVLKLYNQNDHMAEAFRESSWENWGGNIVYRLGSKILATL